MTSKNDQSKPHRQRVVQNFLLVWLDANIASPSEDSQNTIQKLRSVVNDINLFSDPDECVTFLEDVHAEKAFVITSGCLSQEIMPLIHPMVQVDTIYIFCGDKNRHEEWTKEWSKIMGVHTRMAPICEALQIAVKQCNQDSIAISYPELQEEGTSSADLDRLEPSFMYTQLFKKALLDMHHEPEEIQDLVRYCQDKYAGNTHELARIREFGRDYHPEKAIWWYTRECFTYQMLNRALRLLEADIIVNMGFFIHDLHRQLEQMHADQVSRYDGEPFIVYRGQGFTITDFEKLKQSEKGLVSFNSFLSTSQNKKVSLRFARGALKNDSMVGVLFIMAVDPKRTLTPFAQIQEQSHIQAEVEILFAMHTVFRIGSITAIDDERRLFEVNLTITPDNDSQLRALTERLDVEVQGCTEWDRLGRILLQVGNSKKAEELYNTLLLHSSDEGEEALYNQQLGAIKQNQGEYKDAIIFYVKALDIREKTLPANHPELGASHEFVGLVYYHMGEYSKALSFFEKALGIRKIALPANHPDLGDSYHNLGSVYDSMGEYSNALSLHETALDIRQKSLPPNHLDLATSYSNISNVYDHMGEYSKALSFHEKALDIREKTLPANHPELGASHEYVGLVYDHMGEYSKALTFFEKALDIYQKTLPANHPSLATSYNNLGSVYNNIGEYSEALCFYEKALDIFQKTLPANHPDLATSYACIGNVYKNMGEYSKALSFYEKALDMRQKTLPPNHPHLLMVHQSIQIVNGKLSKE
jgi:tetratricopeptide (TPR) repeat protein